MQLDMARQLAAWLRAVVGRPEAWLLRLQQCWGDKSCTGQPRLRHRRGPPALAPCLAVLLHSVPHVSCAASPGTQLCLWLFETTEFHQSKKLKCSLISLKPSPCCRSSLWTQPLHACWAVAHAQRARGP